MVHLDLWPFANHIDGRGLTQYYTIFGDTFEQAVEVCKKHRATLQEIIIVPGKGEKYELLHQGDAPEWKPNT